MSATAFARHDTIRLRSRSSRRPGEAFRRGISSTPARRRGPSPESQTAWPRSRQPHPFRWARRGTRRQAQAGPATRPDRRQGRVRAIPAAAAGLPPCGGAPYRGEAEAGPCRRPHAPTWHWRRRNPAGPARLRPIPSMARPRTKGGAEASSEMASNPLKAASNCPSARALAAASRAGEEDAGGLAAASNRPAGSPARAAARIIERYNTSGFVDDCLVMSLDSPDKSISIRPHAILRIPDAQGRVTEDNPMTRPKTSARAAHLLPLFLATSHAEAARGHSTGDTGLFMGRPPARRFGRSLELKHLLSWTELRRWVGRVFNRGASRLQTRS